MRMALVYPCLFPQDSLTFFKLNGLRRMDKENVGYAYNIFFSAMKKNEAMLFVGK